MGSGRKERRRGKSKKVNSRRNDGSMEVGCVRCLVEKRQPHFFWPSTVVRREVEKEDY